MLHISDGKHEINSPPDNKNLTTEALDINKLQDSVLNHVAWDTFRHVERIKPSDSGGSDTEKSMVSDADSDRIATLEKQRNLSDSSRSCTPNIPMKAAQSDTNSPFLGRKENKGKKWKRNRLKYNNPNTESIPCNRNQINDNLFHRKEIHDPSKQDNYCSNLGISTQHEMTSFINGSDSDSGLGSGPFVSARIGDRLNSTSIRPDGQIMTYVLEQGSTENQVMHPTVQTIGQQSTNLGHDPSSHGYAVSPEVGDSVHNPAPSASIQSQPFQPQYILQNDEYGQHTYVPTGYHNFSENPSAFDPSLNQNYDGSPHHAFPTQGYQSSPLLNPTDIPGMHIPPANSYGIPEGHAPRTFTESDSAVSNPYSATEMTGYQSQFQPANSDVGQPVNMVIQHQVHDFSGYRIEGIYLQDTGASIQATSQMVQQNVHQIRYPISSHIQVPQPSRPIQWQMSNTTQAVQMIDGQYNSCPTSPNLANPSNTQYHSGPSGIFANPSNIILPLGVTVVDENLDTGQTVQVSTSAGDPNTTMEDTADLENSGTVISGHAKALSSDVGDGEEEEEPELKIRSRRLKQDTVLLAAREKRTFVNPPIRASISVSADGNNRERLHNGMEDSEHGCDIKEAIDSGEDSKEDGGISDEEENNKLDSESENTDTDPEKETPNTGKQTEADTHRLVNRKRRKDTHANEHRLSEILVKPEGSTYEALLIIQAIAILLLSLSLLYTFLK